MDYDPENRTLRHNPFKALVAPRPIGWISAMNRAGQLNLAPYSFFNAVAENMVAFSSAGRKDAMTFAEEGADAWYADGARERFLGERAHEDWTKVDDVLDVWFDSGSTHAFTMGDSKQFPGLAGIRRAPEGEDEVM